MILWKHYWSCDVIFLRSDLDLIIVIIAYEYDTISDSSSSVMIVYCVFLGKVYSGLMMVLIPF
jgi:hypothetical protein